MRSLAAWQVPVIWDRRGHHRPDLGYVIDRSRVAIEVELTAKSVHRTRAIMAGYEDRLHFGHLDGPVYITEHPGVTKLIDRAASRAGITHPDRFRIMNLAEMKDETRLLAAQATSTTAASVPEAQRA